MAKILEVNDLITRFYTFDGVVHALSGVSFDLDEGETLGIVGESGSGKSVTMMSLLHLLPTPPARIEGGKALFYSNRNEQNNNTDPVDLLQLDKSGIRKIRGGKIGFIFQDALSALNPVMTIGRQISETLIEHLGMTVDEAKKRSIELLEYVGIPEAEKRFSAYPHQFSGGMRQRTMIAVAIACNPEIIIADEPTTALDVTVQAQIIELVQRLKKEMKMSVIWITHDLGVVAGMADRVLVMYAGSAVEIAPVDDLFYNPGHPYTIKLLGALPKIGEEGQHRLESIDGTPPDLLSPPAHCQFAWRCPHAAEKCWQAVPAAREISPGHHAACFFDFAARRP
ncbi:ABC transporter ATP-binding protein [Desulfamplus magnetovallimortis]|nr:ABC transporter ATP-binding protein [Desulfamplus magnetovallimortis]